MEKTFECLISSFIENKVGLSPNFFTKDLADNLRRNLQSLYKKKQFKEAGIGNNAKFQKNRKLRSDEIFWLDRTHNNIHENSFFDLMDLFVAYLNQNCFAGIKSYEFHYALYNKGSFYKRHLDQFASNKGREFSMIIYLNEDWQNTDGGELCIYHKSNTQIIKPLNRKCVFFKSSELEHEVLTSNAIRMSITGWLKTE